MHQNPNLPMNLARCVKIATLENQRDDVGYFPLHSPPLDILSIILVTFIHLRCFMPMCVKYSFQRFRQHIVNITHAVSDLVHSNTFASEILAKCYI